MAPYPNRKRKKRDDWTEERKKEVTENIQRPEIFQHGSDSDFRCHFLTRSSPRNRPNTQMKMTNHARSGRT